MKVFIRRDALLRGDRTLHLNLCALYGRRKNVVTRDGHSCGVEGKYAAEGSEVYLQGHVQGRLQDNNHGLNIR